MKYSVKNLHDANDFIIHKIVKNPASYSSKIVSLAEKIFKDRKLDSDKKKQFISNYVDLKIKVDNSLKNGSDKLEQIQFLMQNGFNKTHAIDLIEELSYKPKPERSDKSKIFSILFGVFFFFYAGSNILKRLSNSIEDRKIDKQVRLKTVPSIENYANLNKTEFPIETDKIRTLWTKFNSENVEAVDKINIISLNFKSELESKVKDAAYTSEEELAKLTLHEKLKIYSIRKELVQNLNEVEIKSKKLDELNRIYTYLILTSNNYPELEFIKYESETIAYGVFSVGDNYQSVEFQKEFGKWKVNVLKEDPDFKKYRDALIELKLEKFLNEENYVFMLFRNHDYIRKPLLKK